MKSDKNKANVYKTQSVKRLKSLDALNVGGQRWIRTTEGVSQQIYSLPHLATLVFALPFRL